MDSTLHKAMLESAKSKEILNGIYRGVVESISDPLQLGRIKARIIQVYGPPQNTSTADLPWALQCSMFGGGNDYGTKLVPPVGSTVWILFEGGKTEYPVYVGTADSIPSKPVKMLRNNEGTTPKGLVSMSPSNDSNWIAPPGSDGPKETLTQVNNRPERYVVFKSPKGAILDIQDRDEKEHTNLIDRAGQGIFIDGPIKAANDIAPSNEKNYAQRGLTNSLDGNSLPLESTLTNEAAISIIDLGSQSITLSTKKNGNTIKIISKESEELNNLTFGTNKETPGNSNVNLELSAGTNSFVLEIYKEGILQTNLKLDGNSGYLELTSTSITKISAPSIILEGDVQVDGNMVITKELICLDKTIFNNLENGKTGLSPL